MSLQRSFRKCMLPCIVASVLVASLYGFLPGAMDLDGGQNRTGYAGEPIWEYDTDLYVRHVETTDVTGDGIVDVIASEYDSSGYDYPSKVYAINGATGGTLWTYPVNDGLRSMTIGDLNDDGVMDVIAGASMGGTTPDGYVHAINGADGSSLWTYYTGNTNADLAVGNLNGDTYPDVAVACWDDYVHAINGYTGQQLWATEIDSIFINAVDTGDVNDDGIDDVAYCHEYLAGWDNDFGVLDGNDGSVIWNITDTFITVDVLLYDIDSDGWNETVFGVLTDTDEAYIHVRNATNGNLKWDYYLGSCDHVNGDLYLYAQDVEDDAEIDLVIGNYLCTYHVHALEGETDKVIWISDELNGFPRDLSFGDVMGDGILNVVAATYDRVQVLDATAGETVWYYAVSGTIASVATGDFDNDTIVDVAAGGTHAPVGTPPNPAKSVWALRTVDSPLLWEFDADEYGNALAIGNLNGDPQMDVAAVTSNDIVWVIDGKWGTMIWNWTSSGNLYSVVTGDFDNDGVDDVAVAGADQQVTALYGPNGTMMWQFTDPSDSIYRRCLAAGDLDNDGYSDVVVGSNDNYVYAIDGELGTALWSYYLGADAGEVVLSPMGGTGTLDVVTAIESGSGLKKISVLDGVTGNELWNWSSAASPYSMHVAVADMNTDDINDVIVGLSGPDEVVVIDGVTHLPLWTQNVNDFTSDYTLAVGDVNNDSIPEVAVGGGHNDHTVYVLNGINGQSYWDFTAYDDINVILIDDVDLDGSQDVLVGSDDNSLYVLWGKNGSIFWEYPTADDVMHLQIGDISGDGAPNIGAITFGFDGIVYAFASLGIGDISPPIITDILISPISGSDNVNITCQVTDIGGSVSTVWINITDPLQGTTNVPMAPLGEDMYYYNNSFLLLGGYDFMIYAQDGASNSNSSQPLVLMRQAVSAEWNLITIPAAHSWTAESLGENISGCTLVLRFNASSQSFVTHVVGTPYDNFPIEDGVGYFIYVTDDAVLTYGGESITDISVPVSLEWNIIGWPHGTPTLAESLGENISGCTLVLMFDAETQVFTTHVVGTPYDNFVVSRGMGLFVYATSESTWTGEG